MYGGGVLEKTTLTLMALQEVTNMATRRQRIEVYQLPLSPRTEDNMGTASGN